MSAWKKELFSKIDRRIGEAVPDKATAVQKAKYRDAALAVLQEVIDFLKDDETLVPAPDTDPEDYVEHLELTIQDGMSNSGQDLAPMIIDALRDLGGHARDADIGAVHNLLLRMVSERYFFPERTAADIPAKRPAPKVDAWKAEVLEGVRQAVYAIAEKTGHPVEEAVHGPIADPVVQYAYQEFRNGNISEVAYLYKAQKKTSAATYVERLYGAFEQYLAKFVDEEIADALKAAGRPLGESVAVYAVAKARFLAKCFGVR